MQIIHLKHPSNHSGILFTATGKPFLRWQCVIILLTDGKDDGRWFACPNAHTLFQAVKVKDWDVQKEKKTLNKGLSVHMQAEWEDLQHEML